MTAFARHATQLYVFHQSRLWRGMSRLPEDCRVVVILPPTEEQWFEGDVPRFSDQFGIDLQFTMPLGGGMLILPGEL